MFASDMVLEATKDVPYIENTMRAYRQFVEQKQLRLFLVPSATMHGMDLYADSLKKMYETAPGRFHLLDEQGRLPDRTKSAAVAAPRPALPPLDPETIPDDPQYRPRRDGPVFAAKASLQRAGTRATDDDGAAPGAANGENDDHAGDDAAADAADEMHHDCP
jgi:hypothetical protein